MDEITVARYKVSRAHHLVSAMKQVVDAGGTIDVGSLKMVWVSVPELGTLYAALNAAAKILDQKIEGGAACR